LAAEEDVHTVLHREQQGDTGSAWEGREGEQRGLHVAKGWGESSLGLTDLWASLEQPAEPYFFE